MLIKAHDKNDPILQGISRHIFGMVAVTVPSLKSLNDWKETAFSPSALLANKKAVPECNGDIIRPRNCHSYFTVWNFCNRINEDLSSLYFPA